MLEQGDALLLLEVKNCQHIKVRQKKERRCETDVINAG